MCLDLRTDNKLKIAKKDFYVIKDLNIKRNKFVSKYRDFNKNMNTQQKAEYLLNKFYIPLLNENIRLALIFCDEMLIEWNNEGGRLGKIKYWEEVKSIIKNK